MNVADQRGFARPAKPGAPALKSIKLELPPEWSAHLKKLADAAGVSPTACARSLLIELLRDDAIAHGDGGA